ncbi:MAG: hypothetical protein WA426_08980, partial [Silvibacterium sp.]
IANIAWKFTESLRSVREESTSPIEIEPGKPIARDPGKPSNKRSTNPTENERDFAFSLIPLYSLTDIFKNLPRRNAPSYHPARA